MRLDGKCVLVSDRGAENRNRLRFSKASFVGIQNKGNGYGTH
jgi:hypothetical protein